MTKTISAALFIGFLIFSGCEYTPDSSSGSDGQSLNQENFASIVINAEGEVVWEGDCNIISPLDINKIKTKRVSRITGTLRINPKYIIYYKLTFGGTSGTIPQWQEVQSPLLNWLYDLSGLESLTTIDGNLHIYDNLQLKSLKGLENLATVGGVTYISNNKVLKSLGDMENIMTIDGIQIIGNPVLCDLACFNNIQAVKRIVIGENDSLVDCEGLNNIESVDGYLTIYNNKKIVSLMALGKVKSVRYLGIHDNILLTELGLDGLASVDVEFRITNNMSLCQSYAEALRDQVLASDGIGGPVLINNNKDCQAE